MFYQYCPFLFCLNLIQEYKEILHLFEGSTQCFVLSTPRLIVGKQQALLSRVQKTNSSYSLGKVKCILQSKYPETSSKKV